MATNRLATGLAHLAAKRAAHMSESVVYDRDGQQVTINATRGSTKYETIDDGGLLVYGRSVDFIVNAADLILNSVVTEPERGDKVLVTVGNTVLEYDVLAVGDIKEFRPSDPLSTMLRIHTKLGRVT